MTATKHRKYTCNANNDLRKLMLDKGVTQWQIAERMKVHENTIHRALRVELAPDQKANYKRIIEEIAFANAQSTAE